MQSKPPKLCSVGVYPEAGDFTNPYRNVYRTFRYGLEACRAPFTDKIHLVYFCKSPLISTISAGIRYTLQNTQDNLVNHAVLLRVLLCCSWYVLMFFLASGSPLQPHRNERHNNGTVHRVRGRPSTCGLGLRKGAMLL